MRRNGRMRKGRGVRSEEEGRKRRIEEERRISEGREEGKDRSEEGRV